MRRDPSFLGAEARVLFVPYAMYDRDAYAALARKRFAVMGHTLESAHEPGSSIDRADAVFVGGGNTFRLLDALYRHDLLEPIRRNVGRGMPYIGSSAGSIVACPTLKTTKDMPVVEPPSTRSVGAIRSRTISINPTDGMGVAEESIRNTRRTTCPSWVAEGSMLRIEGSTVLRGRAAALLPGAPSGRERIRAT
jgi:peptidase E